MLDSFKILSPLHGSLGDQLPRGPLQPDQRGPVMDLLPTSSVTSDSPSSKSALP